MEKSATKEMEVLFSKKEKYCKTKKNGMLIDKCKTDKLVVSYSFLKP